MNPKISPGSLKAGDILLFHGNSFIAKAIRQFDGTKYNHAAIFNGREVIEAVGSGIETHTLAQATADAEFVGVFRLYKGGIALGSDSLPFAPVGEAILHFQREKDRYAYEQILLLAVLASTRRIPIPMLRWILDHAASVVSSITAIGKQPMICSELVYRCFQKAGAAYLPKILGAGMFNRGLSIMSIEETAKLSEDEPEAIQLKSEFLELYNLAKDEGVDFMTINRLDFKNPNPNFITPGDLFRSPDLRFLGYLEI